MGESYVDPFRGNRETLRQTAPELSCEKHGDSSALRGAIYSDHGFPVIGFFWTDESELSMWQPPHKMYSDFPATPVPDSDGTFGWGGMCEERKQAGYNSGMGLIFRQAAMISPIPGSVQAAIASGNTQPTKDPASGSGDVQPTKDPALSSGDAQPTKDATSSSGD